MVGEGGILLKGRDGEVSREEEEVGNINHGRKRMLHVTLSSDWPSRQSAYSKKTVLSTRSAIGATQRRAVG